MEFGWYRPAATVSPFFGLAKPISCPYVRCNISDPRWRFIAALGVKAKSIRVGKMNDKSQPSCWNLTAKAMVGVAALMVLAWLAGSPDTAAVLAAG